MSMWKKIFGISATGGGVVAGATPATAGGRRTYVVDPAGSDGGKGRRERLPPGAQVKLLQRLARFAKRESLPMAAVFVGKELRAVQDGGDFQGVTVYFAPETEAFPARVASVVRERGRGAQVTVITDDPQVEGAAAAAGAALMRWSTLAKAVDQGGGGSGGGSGGGGGGGKPTGTGGRKPGRNRPRTRRRRDDDDEPRMSRQGGSDTVAVRDLIDLVD
jgi:hypothetical protein